MLPACRVRSLDRVGPLVILPALDALQIGLDALLRVTRARLAFYRLNNVFEMFHAGFPVSPSFHNSELGFLTIVHRSAHMARPSAENIIQAFSLFTSLCFIEGFSHALQAI
jgi:hypothetical protein